MEARLMTPDPGAQPGEPSPADGPGPRELLAYRFARGRWVVAAMILGSSVAGIDSTVVAVALPAIGRNLHAGFQALQGTVTAYTLTLASLILLAGSLSDRWGRRRMFLAGLSWFTLASVACAAAAVRSQRPAGSADRPSAATSGGLPVGRGCVPARRAHRPRRQLLDGRLASGRAVRPRPRVPPAAPDRHRDELSPRLPGGSGLRGEQRRGPGRGPALDRRAPAPHRPDRWRLHRPGTVPFQLRPDQLDLRGSIRLRRGARRSLHHRAWPSHPNTTASAHSNPG